jgi:hypothetical protein
MNVFLTIDRNNMTIYIIAPGKRKMRRTRFVVIRLKGQHTRSEFIVTTERKKKERNEGQTFNLTLDYLDVTRKRNL